MGPSGLLISLTGVLLCASLLLISPSGLIMVLHGLLLGPS